MKKIVLSIVIITLISSLTILKSMPKKPSNLPEEAKWDGHFWSYRLNSFSLYSIGWHPDGTLRSLNYDIKPTGYRIRETYYDNNSIEEIRCLKGGLNSILIGGQSIYYKNGKLKEKKCYNPIFKNKYIVSSVPCGSEIYYDESGNETKRIEHEVKCDDSCDVPRLTFDQVSDIIALQLQKKKNEVLAKNPVVGNIVSIDSSSKSIEILYKPGFELSIGDQMCFLVDGDIVFFKCNANNQGKGIFKLSDDKGGKFLSLKTDSEPRFYKKNETKYGDQLKSKSRPKAGDVKVIAGIEFVYIPEGDFFQADEYDQNKGHIRHINAFWMTKYEVTAGEFLKFSYESNRGLPDNKTALTFNSRYPAAMGKMHNLASGFCDWFGYKHGVQTELPKEIEWEYAARGGTTTPFYWGNDKIDDYAWYNKNSGGKLHPVGLKKPNPFGLYDIIGNAWEWCEPYYLRGGSCQSVESSLRYNVRHLINYEYSDDRDDNSYLTITNQGTCFRMIIRPVE